MDAANYPRTFTLPLFAPPGRLVGIDRTDRDAPSGSATCRLEIGTPRHEVRPLPTPLDDPAAFGCALAKWAYGYAVAERGLRGFDGAPMRQLLAGERRDVFNFVGMPASPATAGRDRLHNLDLDERDGALVVRLGLLGSAGMPPYDVVVGALGMAAGG